jgi:acetone carboxylase gamma subunit
MDDQTPVSPVNTQQPVTYNLDDLKQQIDSEIRPLINYLKSPHDRFNAYMALLQDNWSDELAFKAFQEAKVLDTPEEKVSCLQSLSSEIYFHSTAGNN